jgi:oligopeptide transport system ATP-binding protein
MNAPPSAPGTPSEDLLKVRDLRKHFAVKGGIFSRTVDQVHAVDGVSFDIGKGETLGLVGESGCGKSTTGRCILRLIEPSAGEIWFKGEDVRRMGGDDLRALRRDMQIIFQDPYASLNPRMTVGELLSEALAARGGVQRADRAAEVTRLLRLVSLDERHAGRFPRELSGGQRQRVAIARALAVEPDVLIADEVTSALDVSVQGAILNLLADVRARLGLSILFITHNLALARYVGDVIAVMYLGRIVEVGPVDELLADPRHPYTRALLAAVPALGRRTAAAPTLDVEPADPHAPPPGCHFHPRCPIGPQVREDREVCVACDPWPDAAGRKHRAACHFADAVA